MKSPDQSDPHVMEYGCRVSGRVKCFVLCARTGAVLDERPWQKNLILDAGMDDVATQTWASQLTFGVAGTGTVDTKEVVAGNYSQSGTTVTRDSGSRNFTAGDVGKLIRFASGGESRISAFIGATSVTVVESRAESTQAIAIFNVHHAGLQTELKRSNSYPAFTLPDSTASQTTILTPAEGKITLRRTFDFSEEVGSVTYTEVGVSRQGTGSAPAGTYSQTGTTVTRTSGAGTFSAGDVGKRIQWATGEEAVITVYTNTTTVTVDRSQAVSATTLVLQFVLFNRIKLAAPVALVAEQQLRFTYELTIQIGGVPSVTETTVEGDSVGWPIEYPITNITTDGAKMVVTTAVAHHYVVGGKVNLAGVVMPRTAITAASSTGSDFTITAPGHGKSVADTIVIQGVTPSGYNGTFVVDSVSGDDITVLSLLNPGAGSVFGTVRLANPTPWFDGEWTVAAVPTSTTFEVTTAITPPAPHLPEGVARNNVKRKFVAVHYGVRAIDAPTTLIDRLCTGFSASNNSIGSSGIFDGVSASLRLLQVYLAGTASDNVPQQPTVFPTFFPAQWQGGSATHLSGTQTGRSSADIRFTGTTTTFADAHRKVVAPAAYTRGTFYQDFVYVYTAANFDYNHILFLGMGMNHSTANNSCCQGYFLFQERQKKDSVHKVTLTVRRRWARDLSAEP